MALNSPRMDTDFLRRRPIKNGSPDEDDYLNEDEIDDIEEIDSPENQQGLYPDINKIEREVQHENKKFDSQAQNYIKRSRVTEKTQLTVEPGRIGSVRTKTSYYKEIKDNDSEYFSLKNIVCFIALLVCCGVALWYYFSPAMSKQTVPSTPLCPATVVKRLMENFGNQPALSMRVINSSLLPVIPEKAKPRRPAVIVLTSSVDAAGIAECLAKHIALELKDNYVYIDGSDYSGSDPYEAKEKIDNMISERFRESELNVGVVNKLDKIPADAAMIFHGYCDDTYAQFRKAVYIMTVTTTETIPKDPSFKMMDTILSNRLQEAWGSDLHSDQLMPLLSRLTPSAAVVLPEDHIPKNCIN